VLALAKTGCEPPPGVVVGTRRTVGRAGAVVPEDVVVIAAVVGSLVDVVHVREEPTVARDEDVIRGRLRRAVYVPEVEPRLHGPRRADAVPDVPHPEPLERGRGLAAGRAEDRIEDPDRTADRARRELRDVRVPVRVESGVERWRGVVVGRVRVPVRAVRALGEDSSQKALRRKGADTGRRWDRRTRGRRIAIP